MCKIDHEMNDMVCCLDPSFGMWLGGPMPTNAWRACERESKLVDLFFVSLFS